MVTLQVPSWDLAPGGCQALLLVVAHLRQPWGAEQGIPQSQPLIRVMAASQGAALGHGMCRIGARGWAGFLQQKIPGRSAGGPGLAVSPQSPGWGNPVGIALAWGAAAAPPVPLLAPGDLGCAHAVSAGGMQCLFG